MPPSGSPVASATLPTAADAKVEQARESTATPPTPSSRTPSRSLPRKKLVSLVVLLPHGAQAVPQ